MSDLISRQDALREIRHWLCYKRSTKTPYEVLLELPSAQPEIIRCQDCKYHRQNYAGDSWCGHPKGLDGFELMPTDFCCRAEWKKDENYKQN